MPDLTHKAETVLKLYRKGMFPMADPNGRIHIYTADPRGVVPLDDFHVPQRLVRFMRKNPFQMRVNAAFGAVVRGCAARPDCWISPEITAIYEELNRLGHAHSVEAWLDGELAGGLHGVSVGGAFCGESMFHTVSEASKVCMVTLVERLRARGYVLLDCQFLNKNTERFGGLEISAAEYRRQLRRALLLPCTFA